MVLPTLVDIPYASMHLPLSEMHSRMLWSLLILSVDLAVRLFTIVATLIQVAIYAPCIPLHFTGQTVLQMQFVFAAAVIVTVLSISQLVMEVVQLILHPQVYFTDLASWIKVPYTVCTIIFASTFCNDCLCPTPWQWQVGIVAVFLVWADLIFYVRKIRVLGKRCMLILNDYYVCNSNDDMHSICRYRHLYFNVWEDLQEIFEACYLHSFTDFDVCSHPPHGLPSVPSILWKITIRYSISCVVEDIHNDNRRGGLQ